MTRLSSQQRKALAGRLSDAAATISSEPMAVIGIGCRFPGGLDTPAAFWQALIEGRDVADEHDVAERGGTTTSLPSLPIGDLDRGGRLRGVTGVDVAFFGLTPREAATLDPHQRLLLEVAWEALEHAGIPPLSLEGSATGLFVGAYYTDYLRRALASPTAVDAYTLTGNLHAVTAGRVAFELGLRGPAVAVDTACSSSLEAVHLACQSLRLRECDITLAAGVSVILDPLIGLALDRFGLLSPSGRCRTFDESADGIVRSEGCGVVVLRRLVDALENGDRILSVILATGSNQDGRSNGLTAPSGPAQRALYADVVSRAGIAPDTVGLIETHGTGTRLGDPIEVEALSAVYGGPPGAGACALGALKTNLGHTEAAAGVAGLIKATLAVGCGHIPGNLHLRRVNPDLHLETTRFFLPDGTRDWPVSGHPRRAAVSSFGMGGTNVHLLLEQPPAVDVPVETNDPGPSSLEDLFVMSSVSPDHVRAAVAALADHLETHPELAGPDVAATLSRRRSHRDHRVAVVCGRATLADGLRHAAAGRRRQDIVAGVPSLPSSVVWVFSGHGSQWTGMGRGLLDADPAVEELLDTLAPVYRQETGQGLRDMLQGEDLADRTADLVQPLILVVQLAISRWLLARGVPVDAVLGHSMGEIAAASVAGALGAADALRLSCRRSAALAPYCGSGAMLWVGLPANELTPLLGGSLDLAVAVHASPLSSVVSGTVAATAELRGRLERAEVDVRPVASDVAFHGPWLAPAATRLAAAVNDLAVAASTLPLYSTSANGLPAPYAQALDPSYWARNLLAPVRFSDAVRAAAGDGHRVFLEVSPHPVVLSLVHESVPGALTIPTARRDTPLRRALLTALGGLFCAGVPLRWDLIHDRGGLVDLPGPCWQRRRAWVDPTPPAPRPVQAAVPAPATGPPPGAGRPAAAAAVRPPHAYRIAWRTTDGRQGEGPTAPRTWLVLRDQLEPDGLAAGLADRLACDGHRVRHLPAADLTGAAQGLIQDVDEVLWPALQDGRDAAAALASTAALLRTARWLATLPVAPRLHVVTRGAQPAGAVVTSPVAATLWGAGRGLALEHPAVWGSLLDLDPGVTGGASLADMLGLAAARLTGHGTETEAAIRGDLVLHPRIVPAEFDPPPGGPGTEPRLESPGVCVLVTGAGGSVAPHLIRCLVAGGVRHLVLLARRGPRGPALRAIRAASAAGVVVTELAADVGDEDALRRLFARFGRDLPPLGLVIHAALAGGYRPLADLDDDDLAEMFRAKVRGAELLDDLTMGLPDARLVLFSSTAATIGARGMAHYAAANAYLDALGWSRHGHGRPGAVAGWGAMASWLGATSTEYRESTIESGMFPIDDAEAMANLGPLLRAPWPHHLITAADWRTLADAYHQRTPLRIADEVREAAAVPAAPVGTGGPPASTPDGDFRNRLAESSPEAREPLLLTHVRTVVAEVLGFGDPGELAPDTGFTQLGMDSLQSLQIRRRLSAALSVDLPVSAVFNHPDVRRLARYLVERIDLVTPTDRSEATEPVRGEPDGAQPATDELTARLEERLRRMR
jgi:phthiocerol/phenolphthiocerol synthesis type-I polyketide synthase B